MAAPLEPTAAGAPVAAPALASTLAPGKIVVGAAVNVADFAELARAMTEEDERREVLIKKSREVLKASKGAIYNLHRRDVAKAREQLAGAVAVMKGELLPLVAAYPSLRFSLSGALEEYAEAVVFSEYLASGRIITMAELEICSREEYLGGVMDFVGELNRYAVLRATERDFAAVKHARDTVDQLLAAFMQFDWRNGNLRRKYDALKYTLKKLEQIIYELTLASATGFVPKSGGLDEPAASGGAGVGAGAGAGGDAGTMDEEGAGGAGDGPEGGDGGDYGGDELGGEGGAGGGGGGGGFRGGRGGRPGKRFRRGG